MTWPIAYATPARRAELRAMPYADYLRTPEWAQVRWAALCRDGHACVICGARSALEVHHRTYKRVCEEWLCDVTTLCAVCHERHHEAVGEGKLPPSDDVRAGAMAYVRALPGGVL